MNTTRNFKVGDKVIVDIIKGGYWTDQKGGRCVGFTKTGRIRVESSHWNGVRAFLSDRVRKALKSKFE